MCASDAVVKPITGGLHARGGGQHKDVGRSRPDGRVALSFLLVLAMARCGQTDGGSPRRYVVTASPIDLGIGGGRFCVAFDPGDPKGVWWWEPGKDCSTRSTGPGVFQAEDAMVIPSAPPGSAEVRFRLQLIGPPVSGDSRFVQISLRFEDGQLQASGTGSRVATITRRDLELPEWR